MPDHTEDEHATATELAPGAVRRERELPVPAEDAWPLLEDAEGLERWLADKVDLTVAPGESGTLREGGVDRSVVVEEVEPGRRVALRWWTGGDEADAALVDLTLEPVGDDRSRLVVTEVPLRVVAIPSAVPASWTIDTAGPSMSGAASAAWHRAALAGVA